MITVVGCARERTSATARKRHKQLITGRHIENQLLSGDIFFVLVKTAMPVHQFLSCPETIFNKEKVILQVFMTLFLSLTYVKLYVAFQQMGTESYFWNDL